MKTQFSALLCLLLLQAISAPVTSDNSIKLVIPPQDLEYPWGLTNQNITWMAESDVTGTYEIRVSRIDNESKNVRILEYSTWESNELVTQGLGHLSFGEHIAELTLDNGFRTLKYTSAITITPVAATIPSDIGSSIIFFELPSSIIYEVNTLGNETQWVAYAAEPTYYSIHNDEVTFQNGEWTSLEPIVTNIDGYGIGDHYVTLVLYNAQSVQIRHRVDFEVLKKIIPIITTNTRELIIDETLIFVTLAIFGIMIIATSFAIWYRQRQKFDEMSEK